MNKMNSENRVVQFVKAGTKQKKIVKTEQNILSPSTDWELRVDIITRLIFPEHIVKMWELMVP